MSLVLAVGGLLWPVSPVVASPPTAPSIAAIAQRGLQGLHLDGGRSTAAATGAPASTSDGRPDPLADTISGTDGSQTLEPRSDISEVVFSYGPDRLDIAITIPGGDNPTTSPNWQENFTGAFAALDVNGDGIEDFVTVMVAHSGRLEVATIGVPPAAGPANIEEFAASLCPGTGSFDAAGRTSILSVPSACIGNAYEVRGAAAILYNRATSIADDLDLVIDVAPSGLDLIGVHRDTTRNGGGYRFVASDGGIFSFGNAGFSGSTGDIRLNQPIVGMDTTTSGGGYWLVASDGGIFTFGDAEFFGSTGDIRLIQPIVGMAATPSGKGYWLVARDGGIFTFGDARFAGSPANLALDDIVGMVPTPTGRGYWLAKSTGPVFSYGDARPMASAAGVSASKVVGIAASPSGRGYWLAYADGSVAARGDAAPHGDASGLSLSAPVVGLAGTPTGRGYWLLGRDGGVFSFGDAAFHGSTGDLKLNQPVLDLSA